MKKTLSVFLSLVMLLSCLCFGSITAQAGKGEAKNITSLYDAEHQTLYIQGKGKIPDEYLGLEGDAADDWRCTYFHPDSTITITEPDGTVTVIGPDNPFVQDTLLRYQYPDWYMNMTRHVKKLVIGEGITEIGASAFAGTFDSLEKVVLPSTLKTINNYALSNSSLQSITIPATVQLVYPEFISGNKNAKVIFKGKSTKIFESYTGMIGSYDYLLYCLPGSKIEKQCKYYEKNSQAIEKSRFKTIKTPAQVSGVKAGTTGSTVKLTWNKAKYANRYKVQRYVVSQKKWKTYATVTGTSYTFKNMAGSTNYRFRVIGVNRICDADFSGKASKECKAKTKFGKVLGVKVSAKNGALSVKWNAVREAKSYQVYYATKKDGSYKKLGTASGTSFKKKVTKGKTYYVKVRAVKKNSKGKTVYGAYSDVKSVYVDW